MLNLQDIYNKTKTQQKAHKIRLKRNYTVTFKGVTVLFKLFVCRTFGLGLERLGLESKPIVNSGLKCRRQLL